MTITLKHLNTHLDTFNHTPVFSNLTFKSTAFIKCRETPVLIGSLRNTRWILFWEKRLDASICQNILFMQ